MRQVAWALALAMVAAPALADVKTGVTKWAAKDYAGAVAEWRGPAQAGDPDAQYNLGQAYRRGLGVPEDEDQARGWYEKSAAQGHRQAQASLALMLFQSPRRADAFPWLEKAAAQNETRAQYVLGTALFNGDGIAKDWPRAYALMRRASVGGLQAATASLKQMDSYLSPDDKRRGEAMFRAASSVRTAAATPARPPREAAAPARIEQPRTAQPDAAAKAPATTRKAETAAAPAGRWKVQLGAFGKAEAARAHWKTLSGKSALSALTPTYVERGGMVRLQAGPLADKAAAARACTAAEKAGSACFPLQP